MTRLLLILVACIGFAQQPSHPPAAPAEHGTAPAAAPAEAGHAGPGHSEAVQKGTAHAQAATEHGEGHEEQPMPNEIWWKWANFALLAIVLGYLLNKNLGPFLRDRSAAIQSGIADAAKMRAEAEERAAGIERRIGNLAAEVETMRQQSSGEIAAEGERMRAETEQQIAKVQAQAEQEIASAAKQASENLKAYSAELAVDLAERQIRGRMDDGAQASLTDAFIRDLAGKAAKN